MGRYPKQQWQSDSFSPPFGPLSGSRLQHIEDWLDTIFNNFDAVVPLSPGAGGLFFNVSTGLWENRKILNADVDPAAGIVASKLAGLAVYSSTADLSGVNVDLGWNGSSAQELFQYITVGGGSLRSIAAPSAGAGVRLTLRNVSGSSVTLHHQSTGGSGVELFLRGAVDVALKNDEVIEFIYDGTSWVEVGRDQSGNVLLYQKNGALVDITGAGGRTETDLLNCTLKATDVSSSSQFSFWLDCDFLDAVAAATFQIRVYLGATKIYDSGAFSMEFGGAVSGSRQPFPIIGNLGLKNALNSQAFTMITGHQIPSSGSPPVGEGFVGGTGGSLTPQFATASVDMSQDQIFRITGVWSLADNNHSFRKHTSRIVIYS